MSFTVSQIQGQVNTGLPATSFCFGPPQRIDNWNITETGDVRARTHFSFGGLCVGRNDELYVVCRGGYAHGISSGSGNIGGNLYWAVSTDYGGTWSDPQLFLAADSGRDLRDVTLTYDAFTDKYILMYTDLNTDYESESYFHILMGDEPFVDMSDITPDQLPFTYHNQTYTKPVRYGDWYYIPLYGTDSQGGTLNIGLLRSSNGSSLDQFSTFEVVKKWDDTTQCNEVCAYLTYDSTSKKTRFNLLTRGDGEYGWVTYCDDKMETWSEKASVGFQCAGGPQVFDVDGVLMLVAREQANTATYESSFVIFSYDQGQTWTNRCLISNTGPCYSTLVRFKNGKTFLSYCEERGTFGHIFMRELVRIPAYNTLT